MGTRRKDAPATRLRYPQALLLSSLLCLACNKDDSAPLSPGVNQISNVLRFTRQDSTEIAMGTSYAVCCATWEPGFIDKPALKVLFYDEQGAKGGWKLFLLSAEAKQDTAYLLPTPSASGQSAVTLFVVDFQQGNEASSSVPGSSGSITIHSFSCGAATRIDVFIDAVLGSEFYGGSPIRVQGWFAATAYSSPIGCSFSL